MNPFEGLPVSNNKKRRNKKKKKRLSPSSTGTASTCLSGEEDTYEPEAINKCKFTYTNNENGKFEIETGIVGDKFRILTTDLSTFEEAKIVYKDLYSFEDLKNINIYFRIFENLEEATEEINEKLKKGKFTLETDESNSGGINLIIDKYIAEGNQIVIKISGTIVKKDELIKVLMNQVIKINDKINQLSKDTKSLALHIQEAKKEGQEMSMEVGKLRCGRK